MNSVPGLVKEQKNKSETFGSSLYQEIRNHVKVSLQTSENICLIRKRDLVLQKFVFEMISLQQDASRKPLQK